MKNFSVTVIAVFIVLIGMIIGFSLEALIIWGIGNLILWLLNINLVKVG